MFLHEFAAVGGWEVSAEYSTIDAGVRKADVLNYAHRAFLQEKMPQYFDEITPGVFQHKWTEIDSRVSKESIFEDNYVSKHDAAQKLARDIDTFAENNKLDNVVVVYSGSTERCSKLPDQSYEEYLHTLLNDVDDEVSPSQLYAAGTCLSRHGKVFINAAANNTCDIGGLQKLAYASSVVSMPRTLAQVCTSSMNGSMRFKAMCQPLI